MILSIHKKLSMLKKFEYARTKFWESRWTRQKCCPKTTLAPHLLWPQTYFSRRHNSAQGILRPNEYFGSINTSAWCLLQPEIHQPGNTSARKYFSPKQLRPNTLWPQDQIFKSVIFNQLGPSMGLGGYLPGVAKICQAKAKYQNDKKNTIIWLKKDFLV